MTNRKYEKIKGYTKIAKEEIMNSLGFTEEMAETTLIYALRDIRGQHLNTNQQEILFLRTRYLDAYVMVYALAEELNAIMEGGKLPEEA